MCGFSSGNVTVRGYVLSSDVVFEQSIHAGKDISSPHNVTFSSSVYSIDSSLVSVQVIVCVCVCVCVCVFYNSNCFHFKLLFEKQFKL
jgi:hypothetical protein